MTALGSATAAGLADAVLLLHVAVVAFVVLGLPAILVGNRLGWAWVNRTGWRLAHLAAIAVVVLQAWLGQYCVLTVWESLLRQQAGQAVYERSFIAHWVQRLLYHEAPLWVFALVYTGFAALVAWAWWRHPPAAWRRPGRRVPPHHRPHGAGMAARRPGDGA